MVMARNLLDLFTKTRGAVPYEPAQRFLELHTIDHIPDRNGNGDDVFKGDNVETYKRDEHRYGRDQAETFKKWYEDNEDLVAHIQQAHKAVAQRWLAAAQSNADEGGDNALSRLSPVISQIVSKY